MAQFNGASLKEVEDFVIQTGEPQIVYGVGPVCATKAENPLEALKGFSFYENVDDAQKAFMTYINAGESGACDEVEFYLNEEGYIQVRNIKCLDEIINK